ncbi:glucan endo-1,6-beta-glucosidase B [Phyllosticta paracitricarpa]|uniref:glucan endo-1,6-beta-glucosidase n=1 Tax=Phyllosticta paracitricarpa TaxID=2016321 RepID=A0ABR1MY63_9PEZI
MYCTLFPLLISALLVRAWLPDSAPSSASLSAFANSVTIKIRGVNAGSQYILEPWMAADVWQNTLGCGDAQAERQCVETTYNGDMDAAGAAWQTHWDSWITQDDIRQMVAYGGFDHLVKFCGWASDAGLYIIIDLHGLPGRQVANNAFTGDYQSTTGFYQSDYESERAYEFLSWMTNQTHTNNAFRNVGTIEIVNEPKREDSGDTEWLVEHYYGSAIDAVTGAEEALGVADAARLHIAVMDDLWCVPTIPPVSSFAFFSPLVRSFLDFPLPDHHIPPFAHPSLTNMARGSGPSPSTALTTTQLSRLLYDDHNYQHSPITECGGALVCALSYTCSETVGQGNRVDSQTPKFVGEWALKLDQLAGQEEENREFFEQYFAAQMDMYERTSGWVYWSWKVVGNANFTDALQWGYSNAVTAGIIDPDLNAMLEKSPC